MDKIPELKGNGSYKTNFKKVQYGDKVGNGLVYANDEYLYVQCPKSVHFVAGVLFRKSDKDGCWNPVQVNQVNDNKATEEIENTLKFKLIRANGEYFREGEYRLKVNADGTNGWTDEFFIGHHEVTDDDKS